MARDERSLTGCAAGLMIDAAPFDSESEEDRRSQTRRTARPQKPQPGDGIPAGMCWRCGFKIAPSFPHRTALDCISVLRDALAMAAPPHPNARKVKRAGAGG
jgi:hypothetical protein